MSIKSIKEASKLMPHNGTLLRRFIKENNLTYIEVAKHIGVAPQTIPYYVGRNTLQAQVLWRASIAFEHNFFSDLCNKLPIPDINENVPTEREIKLQEQLDRLEKENERLRIELSVYEKILKKS